MMLAAVEMFAQLEPKPGSDARSAQSGGFSQELDARLGGSEAEGRGERAEQPAPEDADAPVADEQVRSEAAPAQTGSEAQPANPQPSAPAPEADAVPERAGGDPRASAEPGVAARAEALARTLHELAAARAATGPAAGHGSAEAVRDARLADANATREPVEGAQAKPQDLQVAQGRSPAELSAEASSETPRNGAGPERALASLTRGQTPATADSDPTSSVARASEERGAARSGTDTDARRESDGDRSGVREELRREALGLERLAPARDLREGSATTPQDFAASLARAAGSAAPSADAASSGPEPVPLEAPIPAPATTTSMGARVPGGAPVVSTIGDLPFHMQTLATRGGGTARLQLNPPHLGELQVTVRMRGSQVDVQVIAREPAAQALVNAGREGLGDALAARDLRMDHFEVTLARDASAGGPGPDDAPTGGWERDPEREAAGWPPLSRRAVAEPGQAALASAPPPERSDSSVDLRI